jgi:site-specific recombinase XerD
MDSTNSEGEQPGDQADLVDPDDELILPATAATSTVLTIVSPNAGNAILQSGGGKGMPALSRLVASGGDNAARRFLEFFTVTIRNAHTRRAYYRAVSALLDYCEARGVVDLKQIQPMMIASFIEVRTTEKSAPTVKQELAAIRQMFDYLVTGHIVDTNPAAAVRGPRYSIAKGKTPVLDREEARRLLLSIPTIYKVSEKADGEAREVEMPCLVGLRDRALIGLMVYSFARVGAVTKLKVGDYYQNGKRYFVGLHEKGGKYHELPVHHMAEEYIDAYLAAAGISPTEKETRKTPLFRSSRGWTRELSDKGMTPSDVLFMVKRRAAAADLSPAICCHTFRATGITAYLENGGTVENAQNIANHADPRTTRLYDRRSDKISLTEIERIQL